MQDDSSKKGMLGLQLSKLSGTRLLRLRSRHSFLDKWKFFQLVFRTLEDSPDTLELDSATFDALIAFWQFLHAEAKMEDAEFDAVADIIISKINNKGGAKCEIEQIQDIIYEGQVALLLKMFVPGTFIIQKDDNEPDIIFECKFEVDRCAYAVAIELKNLRKHRTDIRDLIRSVTQSIESAVNQHKQRAEKYNDLLIFIDLPIEILLEEHTRYIILLCNVWRQLQLDGYEDICESQVIFTATSQENMFSYLSCEQDRVRSMTILRPLLCGKKQAIMKMPRALFLAYLFRFDRSMSPSTDHWSNVAKTIDNPHAYWIES